MFNDETSTATLPSTNGNGNGHAANKKRERSAKYPGVGLDDSVDLCVFIDSKGLDGLPATEIATTLGFKNIKTNTFSSRLSAARQFGLLTLKDDGYNLTQLAKSIIHPVDPADLPRLRKAAFMEPPLYALMAERYTNKRLPEANILGNVLYHDFHIIVAAKQVAAEAFISSAKYAQILGEDSILRPHGASSSTTPPLNPPPPPIPLEPSRSTMPLFTTPNAPAPTASATAPAPTQTTIATAKPAANLAPLNEEEPVRVDLRLWGADQGKVVRVRAPESITPDSFERLIQTLKLHIRIEESED